MKHLCKTGQHERLCSDCIKIRNSIKELKLPVDGSLYDTNKFIQVTYRVETGDRTLDLPLLLHLFEANDFTEDDCLKNVQDTRMQFYEREFDGGDAYYTSFIIKAKIQSL